MIGIIYKVNSGFYYVKGKENKKDYTLKLSGILRDKKIFPRVGDEIIFNEGMVLKELIEPKNYLIRPKVSNVDQVVIINSIDQPKYNDFILVKLLSIIEYQDITPIIVFSKSDLNDKFVDNYNNFGYKTIKISNQTGEGINELMKALVNKRSVFTGQSGAGKTSTINSITNQKLETQEISRSLGRGKTTTRITEMFEYNGAEIIDTPGFSVFEVNLDKNELSKSFQLFKKESVHCKFTNCLHYKEEDCRIKDLLEKNKISKTIYNNYIRLIKELSNE
ncbi:MAG: ribosome small subunit-dependent GTPase A [Mycoplasma sp.]|nr:ribosome small subunit-dependent GTPase A [Mycoplasma sp.]